MQAPAPGGASWAPLLAEAVGSPAGSQRGFPGERTWVSLSSSTARLLLSFPRLSSEKSSLQPPAVGRRHAVVISSSVSLVRSCRATSVWGIQVREAWGGSALRPMVWGKAPALLNLRSCGFSLVPGSLTLT